MAKSSPQQARKAPRRKQSQTMAGERNRSDDARLVFGVIIAVALIGFGWWLRGKAAPTPPQTGVQQQSQEQDDFPPKPTFGPDPKD